MMGQGIQDGDAFGEGVCDVDEAGTTIDHETGGFYPFRDLARDVLSPGAVGTMEQLTPRIKEIYGLSELLDARLPLASRDEHATYLVNRIRRIVKMLPPDISPMPNEVFTAIEFLVHEIHGEPVQIGLALLRLESLADEIRARPLLHDLVMNRAN
jgi:hypothetical protein